MSKMKIKVKILDESITEKDLQPKTPGSAGIDLMAMSYEDTELYHDEVMVLAPGEVRLISTGIAIHIADPGYAAIILPRSGRGHKEGLILGNTVGLIDSDYQGELLISAWNRSDERITIGQSGSRIAQLVIVPVVRPEFDIVDSFEESERGGGGFGSTDKPFIAVFG
jgi:dUTP pyrophosphatase